MNYGLQDYSYKAKENQLPFLKGHSGVGVRMALHSFIYSFILEFTSVIGVVRASFHSLIRTYIHTYMHSIYL